MKGVFIPRHNSYKVYATLCAENRNQAFPDMDSRNTLDFARNFAEQSKEIIKSGVSDIINDMMRSDISPHTTRNENGVSDKGCVWN